MAQLVQLRTNLCQKGRPSLSNVLSIANQKTMSSYQKNKYITPLTPSYIKRGQGKQFIPRKPVRTFRDLDIYQKSMECTVIITKNMKAKLKTLRYDFLENMINCSMSVPLYIGEAHSIRFADFGAGVATLEKAMAGCNKMIVYLEQIKGVYGAKVDTGLIDDLIGRYAETRIKTFHLEKSWMRFNVSVPKLTERYAK